MKNMKKRIVSILAMLCMILTMAPVAMPDTAYAAANTNYKLTGNQIYDIIAVAVAQEGKIHTDFGFTGDFADAWCGAFVSWCSKKAGTTSAVPSTITGGKSSIFNVVQSGKGDFYCFSDMTAQYNYCKNNLNSTGKQHLYAINRNSVIAGTSSFLPKKGDIIVLAKPESSSPPFDHVGLVRSNFKKGASVATVEGNTGSAKPRKVEVKTRSFNISTSSDILTIVGFVRPYYNGTSSTPDPTPEPTPDPTPKTVTYSGVNVTIGSYVTLKNTGSGKMLNVYGSKNASNTNVTVYEKDNTSGQNWKLIDKGSGKFVLEPQCAKSCALNVYGTSSTANSNVNIWTKSGNPTQSWKITYNSSLKGYVIRSADNENYVLTAKGSSNSSDVRLAKYDASNKYQVWTSSAFSSKKVDPSMSFSPTSVTVDEGKSSKVNITFKGDGIANLSCQAANSSICSLKWGDVDYKTGKTSITVTGKKAGSTNVTISLLDKNKKVLYKKEFKVTVNVVKITLSTDKSSMDLDLKSTPKGSVQLKWNSIPSGAKLQVTYGDKNIVSSVSGKQSSGGTTAALTAKKTGSTWVQYAIVDSSGKELAKTRVNVKVTAPTYSVKYDANGGSSAPAAQTKQYQNALTLSTAKPSRAGYVFNGWSTSATGAAAYQPGGKYTADKNATLYAVWEPGGGTPYTVRHMLETLSGEYELADTEELTGRTDSTVTPNCREYEGFIAPQSQRVTVSGNGKTVVTYRYQRASYQVTLESGEGIVSVDGAGTYRYGERVQVNAATQQGYEWEAWAGDARVEGSDAQSYQFTMPAGNVSLTASSKLIPEPTPDSTPDLTPSPEPDSRPVTGEEVVTLPNPEPDTVIDNPSDNDDFSDNGNNDDNDDIGNFDQDDITQDIPVIPDTTSGLENFKPTRTYTEGQFRDVKSNDWFAKNVSTGYRIGLMNGTGANTFSPYNNISLAEAVTLAARLHKIYHTGSDQFESYDGGNWYDPYVNYVKKEGILSENYNYTRPATREQFVHILAQALPEEALEDRGNDISFADGNSVLYSGDLDLLCRAGVITGISENGAMYFKPGNTITRAEVTTIVTRMASPSLRVG